MSFHPSAASDALSTPTCPATVSPPRRQLPGPARHQLRPGHQGEPLRPLVLQQGVLPLLQTPSLLGPAAAPRRREHLLRGPPQLLGPLHGHPARGRPGCEDETLSLCSPPGEGEPPDRAAPAREGVLRATRTACLWFPSRRHPAWHPAPAQGPGNVLSPSRAVGPRRAGAARRARCHLGPGSCLACSFQSNCVSQPLSTCLVPRSSHARRDPLHFTPREEALFLTAHYHTVVSQYSCLLIKWSCLRWHRGLPAAPAGGVGWRQALRAGLSSS